MSKGLAIIFLMVFSVVILLCIFAIFPMILEGAHELNQTTNVTEYYGLSELNLLSPTIIWVIVIAGILGSFGWIFRGSIKRKFFGGE